MNFSYNLNVHTMTQLTADALRKPGNCNCSVKGIGRPSFSCEKHTYLAQRIPWSWRRFLQDEAHHCTPVLLTPAITPNVGNSGA